MIPHPEQLALSIVLERLFVEGRDALRNAKSIGTKQLRIVPSLYPSLSKPEIDNLQWSNWKSSFQANRVMYLPPPNGASISALWYKWHFRADQPISMCKFYYGVWRMGDPHPKPTILPVTRVMSFTGFRFEPPEVQGTNHSYFHSQPCRSMGDKTTPDPYAMDIDDKGPTMPLAAKSAVDLLLCAYMALYGATKFKTFANALRLEPKVRRNRELTDALNRISALALR